MKKLRVALLLGVIVLSMFAFTGFIMPAARASPAFRITVVYYKAYIRNDHDPGGMGAGEWYFRLYGAGSWTSYAYRSRNGPGWCDFSDRVKSWYFTGVPSFRCQARERDGSWDYSSTVTVRIYEWVFGVWYYWYYRVGDVTHYFAYIIIIT